MAGYKENFGGNVDYAMGRSKDMTNQIQSTAKGFASGTKGLAEMASGALRAKRGMKDLGDSMNDLRNNIEEATDPKEIRRLTREFENARKSADKLRKSLMQMPLDLMEKGLGGVTKGLLKFNTSILSIGFDFLISSIKRVYELQEKWTQAIGGFNMKMGGMTKGMAGATKAATMWSSTIRGLTGGDINEGIKMFEDFTFAIGRTVDMTVKADKSWAKLGVQVARGFGLGGAATGQLFKSFENIGMSANDSAEAMKTTIKAANAAGIPVNMLAEDLSKSVTYMARFGKEGQKTLIQGAAWARKYDISLEQLKQTVEGFDMFDDAAKSSSKLNAAFGTMINSMDLMMEDDPAKRLEMIRQQMLSQGMTYDKLSPKQRRYFSETMKLSEEQTAALLSSQNAGESYADFQAKAEQKQKAELSAKAMMQKMLVKTAQTMYAFGAAFDRVTVAIGKAIRPLLEVLGLAKKGDKSFGGFGSVMENITKTVIKFFESLAGNDKWMAFMHELGKDLQRAGTALKSFVMDGRAADLVGDLASGMKSFYITVRDLAIKAMPMFRPFLNVILDLSKYIKELAIAWGGIKLFNAVGGIDTVGKIAGMLGGGGKGKGKERDDEGSRMDFGDWRAEQGLRGNKKSRFSPSVGRGIGGVVAGVGSAIAGGGGAGAAIGGALGGLAGAFIPFIGPLLGPAGAALGGWIESVFGAKEKTEVETAQERLSASIKKNADEMSRYSNILKFGAARQEARDNIRKNADEMIHSMKKGQLKDGELDVKLLKERVVSLQGFGKNTKDVASAMKTLAADGDLTKVQLRAISAASLDYNDKLIKLRQSADALFERQMASVAVQNSKIEQARLEEDIVKEERELALAKTRQTSAGGLLQTAQKGLIPGNWSKGAQKEAEKMTAVKGKIDKEVKDKELKLIVLKERFEKEKFDADRKMRLLEIQRMIASDASFLEFKQKHASTGMNEKDMLSTFIATGGVAKTGLSISTEDIRGITKLASGGVVTRPTKALIGEAGPEAVIPLSRMRENLAGGGSSGAGGTMVTQIAEITLDGQKVGRALVRSTIRGRN